MLEAIFGIVCGVAGFAIGWNMCRKELLLDLFEKKMLDEQSFRNEYDKDF